MLFYQNKVWRYLLCRMFGHRSEFSASGKRGWCLRCGKRNLVSFKKGREYGCSVKLDSSDDIELAKKILCDNMKLFIPKKYREFVTYPINYRKSSIIKVKEDNFEQLNATKDEMGKWLDIPNHWIASWHYRMVPQENGIKAQYA